MKLEAGDPCVTGPNRPQQSSHLHRRWCGFSQTEGRGQGIAQLTRTTWMTRPSTCWGVWLYFCGDLRYRDCEARRAKRDAACPSQADDDALTGWLRGGQEVTGWVLAAEAPMMGRMGPTG
jgi:hypothetical protein